MLESLDPQIAEARRTLDEHRARRTELPRLQEKLADATHRLNRAEACIEEVETRVRELGSLTLTRLLQSLLGKKQANLGAHRAELESLNRELSESQTALEDLTSQVRRIEDFLAASPAAERAFCELCEEKARRVLEQGGAPADELRRINGELESSRGWLRAVKKAGDSGRQLLKHLESLDRAVRNARSSRRFGGVVGGAVGAVVKNAVASMGPKSTIRYVAAGVERFLRDVGELTLTDDPEDQQLLQHRAELEAFGASVAAHGTGLMGWDQVATLPAQTTLQAVLHLLKSWTRDAELAEQEQNRRRLDLIERA